MVRPTALNYVTTPYGKPGSWAAGYHTGIDYRAYEGTPIYATRGGKIVHSGTGGTYGSAYGNYVVLQTRYKLRTRQVLYAHLSKNTVKVGQKVKAGDQIGLSGDTGNAFGAHLHYEERLYPFGYWNHYRPVLPAWQPKSRKWLKKILRKIGVLKK